MAQSSIRERYEMVKRFYPSTILLFVAGYFYEAYCEDAEEVVKATGLNAIRHNDYSICGFPKHKLYEYREKIERKVRQVTIVDRDLEKTLIKKASNMENKVIKTEALGYIPKVESNYYMFNQETGILEEVSIQSIIFNLKTGKIVYNMQHCESVSQVVAKEDFESEFTLKLYRNECEYTKQKPITCKYDFNVHALMRAMNCSFGVNRLPDCTYTLIGHALKNGEPVEVNALDYFDEVEITWDERGMIKYLIKYIDKKPDFDHIYLYKEDLFRFESVKVANNDGKITKTDAPMAMLRLTEEQQKVLDNFLAARKALKEAGVGLIFDREDWDMYAVNINNFERINSDEPNNSFEEYLNEDILLIKRLPQTMNIGFGITGNFDHDYLSVLCKIKK